MVFPAALAYEVSAAAESSPPEMVRIPAGPFIFGSSEEDIRWAARTFFSESLEYYKDETPARKMALDAFFIDKTEVTMGQYKRYSESTGNPPPKYGENGKFNAKDQPVVGVSWREAAGFCAWAGKRLPTEPEWEKAARGPDGRYYPWGQTPDPVLANVRGKKDGFRYTAPAGSFPPGQSLFGVMDLAGNVWEWTADWYGPHPGNTMESDLFGETFKVIKGGSWFSNLDLARASVRGKALPENRKNYIGFRCARGADNPSTQ
ncbi:MAG: formylglycine-generating enzyme family protein [Nitrospinaceae bacterium]